MKKILLLGEPMALLIADECGPLEKCRHFTRSLSGAEVNVAIGLTRLGHDVEYVTRLGDDPFGVYIAGELERQHIGTKFIKYDRIFRTGIQLKERVEDGSDPYAPYYRKDSAASHICADDIDRIDLSGVDLIHVTGIPPALSASALDASMRLMQRAKKNGITLTFDPNLRPALWEDRNRMIEVINQLSDFADILLPGIRECEILTGKIDMESAADFYHNRGVKNVIIKVGKCGAFLSQLFDKGTVKRMMVPGFSVSKVVDTVGAGDGFAVGVLSGLLKNMSLRECLIRANAIGAIQVQHRGDNEGLPTEEQLQQFIADHAGTVVL